jgi:hypothetical protein
MWPSRAPDTTDATTDTPDNNNADAPTTPDTPVGPADALDAAAAPTRRHDAATADADADSAIVDDEDDVDLGPGVVRGDGEAARDTEGGVDAVDATIDDGAADAVDVIDDHVIDDIADMGIPLGVDASDPGPDAIPMAAPDPPSAVSGPSSPPPRPPLLRDAQPASPSDDLPIESTPPPPSYEPPPQQQNQQEQPQAADSLSLAQLRNIVAKMRRGDAVAYDFVYGDMGPLAEEIDEWFPLYLTPEDTTRLLALQDEFERLWSRAVAAAGPDKTELLWGEAGAEDKRRFLELALSELQSRDDAPRQAAACAIAYVVLGDWVDNGSAGANTAADASSRHVATQWQLDAIAEGVRVVVVEAGALPVVWRALIDAFERFWYVNERRTRRGCGRWLSNSNP